MLNGYDTREMLLLLLHGNDHTTDNVLGIFRDKGTANEIGRLMVAIHPDWYAGFSVVGNNWNNTED